MQEYVLGEKFLNVLVIQFPQGGENSVLRTVAGILDAVTSTTLIRIKLC